MKKTIFKVILTVISLPIAIILGLAVYNAIEIRPKLPTIEAILQNASPQDRNPPQVITTLIHQEPNANSYVITTLLNKFYPPSSQAMTQSNWHLRQALWQLLLPLNLTQEQQDGLFTTLANTGLTDEQGNLKQGLNNFALYRYGKSLDQLDPYQSATVVAVTHSPTRLLKDEALLNQRVNWLLSQVKTP